MDERRFTNGLAAIGQPTADLVFQPLNPGRIQAVAGGRTLGLTMDQAGLAQHLEVLADGGLGQRQFLDDIIGDAGFFFGQVFHDLKTDRVAKGLEHARKPFLISGQVCC